MTDKIRKDLEKAGFVEVMADVNLEYGGVFMRDHDWFDVIRITGLDSACGADGQILVEALTTSFDYVRGKAQWQSILSFSDAKRYLTQSHISKADKRLLLAEAIVSYGIYDPASYSQSYFVAILDRKAHKDAREPWEANVKGWGYAAFRRAVNMAIDCF